MFNVEDMVNGAFHQQNGHGEPDLSGKNHVYTRPTVENSTVEIETIEFSTVKGRAIVTGEDEIPTEEPYQPLNEDTRGRETEIARCRLTRKLFERYKGQPKEFINAQAKSRYHYLKKLEAAGTPPKDGWPPGWKYG